MRNFFLEGRGELQGVFIVVYVKQNDQEMTMKNTYG